MERKFKFAVDEYYHLYNRGNNKQSIYLDPQDKQHFYNLIFLANGTQPIEARRFLKKSGGLTSVKLGESLVDIGAYCLMDNHFHLLVREKTENGISRLMRKLSTAYAMYFNLKHKRTGGIFEGTFRARHVNNDNHLKYVAAYIHLNPLKLYQPDWRERGIADTLESQTYLDNYSHSSYSDYTGAKKDLLLNRQAFPEYFQTPKEFKDYLTDWLIYADSSHTEV